MIRGDLRGALEAFRLSHLGYQTLAMRNHEAQVLNNIALAYMELGELADAEKAYNQAALAFEEDGDHARQLDLEVNKVQLYIAGKRYDEALAQCEKLLGVTGSESAPWRGEVFRHLGVIARERGDFVTATEHLLKAEQHAIDSGDLLLRADVSEQLAEVYWTQKRHRDMKRHPEAGLELVADIDFPGDVRSIIRNHHERWDGHGYPDGLAGEEIPITARILCVADVYDALTTARSYRDSLSHNRAAQVMRESTGQFDPHLLEIFLDWASSANALAHNTPQGLATFAIGNTG